MKYYHLFTNEVHPENPDVPKYMGVVWASDFNEACRLYLERNTLAKGKYLFDGWKQAKRYMNGR